MEQTFSPESLTLRTIETTDALMAKPTAKTWDGLTRIAFATDWDPEKAINWSLPVDMTRVKPGWVSIMHHFYEGEWQGLEVIQRLMNRAAHLFKVPEMITYYSTQCYDESKHLYVFRTYLNRIGSPPKKQKAVDPLVFLATRGPMPVERWILATYFTETLAASIFNRVSQLDTVDPLGKEMIRLQAKDESRHIAGTRLGVKTLMDHSGPIKTFILRLWWKLFYSLAQREVRKLDVYGEQIGMRSEDILAKTRDKMEEIEEFKVKFLD